jgi:transposase-like protein
VGYPLSYRQLEEMMRERGAAIDHATIHRRVPKYSQLLEEAFQRRKGPVWLSWRMDKAYIQSQRSVVCPRITVSELSVVRTTTYVCLG